MGEILREILNLFSRDEPPTLKIAKGMAIIVTILVVVLALESGMGLITIGRLERKVNLLKEMNALAIAGLDENLAGIFDETAKELQHFDPSVGGVLSKFLPANENLGVGDLLPGTLPWILLALLMLKTTRGNILTKIGASLLVVALGLPFGSIVAIVIKSPDTTIAFGSRCFLGLLLMGLTFFAVYQLIPGKRSQTESCEDSDAANI